ncbi:urate hydroxylase PuuD [Mangrovicoccus sp. HB161399]|uniref:urate hydroxylase PuuD n=1 Tax=Mangrovicoccus sp. HB161399 TaxID=2720392 RepID=UPI001556029F|nr:urate hydroxylase PuuD [Mangrovicoccus sp. HB161399]
MTLIEAWAEFAVRWLHVITGIAWIGSSFYFIALDLGLRPPLEPKEGVKGEEWQVHGGGFYHIQKYLVAPAKMPEDLVWFKWEAYTTWLSGFALLILVYYLGADFYLVDPNTLDIPSWAAILISVGSLAFGWIAYDLICKSKYGDDHTKLMIGLYVILVVIAFFYTHVFSGRAAMLHLGAFTATIMSANVFFVIMPNQRITVADLKAGRTPDPKYGIIAKQRSTHNNYLTLPVLFLMLSNHYPLAFASQWNWLIAALVFLMGVTIRHFFNTMHATKKLLWWTWGATALLFLAIVGLSLAPVQNMDWEDEAKLTPAAQRYAAAPGFEEAAELVINNCSMCHAPEPGVPGLGHAPNAVRLDSEGWVATHARDIYLQAGVTHAMPPGAYNYMTDEDRAVLVAWYRAAQ